MGLILAVGCQSNYESKSVGPVLGDELDNNPEGNEGQETNLPGPGGTWGDVEKVMTSSSIEGSEFDGKTTIRIDQPGQALIFQIPVSAPLSLPVFKDTPIPNLLGATISHLFSFETGREFQVRIPFKYIVRGGQLSPYDRLPNGFALPFIPAVESQGFAIALPQAPNYRLHLYFAPNAAAAYIELPEVPEIPGFPTYMGFPVKNKEKTQQTGWLAYYAKVGGSNAGVYAASRIPDSVARLIDELIRY
jgi:hypothetical protein